MYKLTKRFDKAKSKWEHVNLYICDSCNKPISNTIDTVLTVDGRSEKKLYYFHQSPMDCANAEPESIPFRRHVEPLTQKARR